MYMSLSLDPYRQDVMTSMRRISSPLEITKLIKKQKVIAFMIGEYVSLYSILCLCEKFYATNRALYLLISLF